MLQGLPVDGLMREHLCGPAWELRSRRAAELRPEAEGPGDSVEREYGDAMSEAEPPESSAEERREW